MPQADTTRGNAGKSKKIKKKPYSPPPSSRSDAAQRTGARTPKPKPVSVRPQTKTPAAPPKPTPKPRPKADPVKVAKQQERAYESQGRAVERDARRKTRIRKREARYRARARGKSDAAQGNSTREAERRGRGKSDVAQGNRTSEAESFKQSREYIEALRAARKARYDRASPAEKKRLFGTPREDAKDPKILARYKAEDDRLTELNRTRLRETVDRELSGEGKVAKVFADAAKGVEGILKSGARGGSGRGGGSRFAAITPAPLRGPSGKVAIRAAKDAVNFPAQAVPSVYVPAAGVVEAAQGRPERLKRYVEDVKQTDPIYNTVAAGVAAARGDTKAAKSHIKKAGKAASEHPGFTAFEVVGAKGTLGRGTGRVMRSGVVGKKAKRAASTRRAPATVPGTRIVKKREYSPDVIKKSRQVIVEKQQIKRAEKTRAKAKTEKDPDVKVELLRKANRQDPRVASSREVRRRVDERVDVNEGKRRLHRTQTQVATRKIVKKVRRKDRPAISVVAQNITRASKDDIRAYIGELKDQHPALDAAGQRANTRLRRDLQRIVNDPKADLGKVQDAARAYEELTAPLQAGLVKSGMLAGGRADKAKLIPYATRNMGLKHDKDQGVVTESGIPVSADQIRLHMEASGVEEPAFLSQAANQRGARNFNIRSERAQSISRRRRTGEATTKGTFDAHPETLTENAVRARGLVDATDGFRGFVDELAVRSDDKVETFGTKTDADAAKANLEAKTGERYRPIRLNPFDGPAEQLQALLDDVNSDNQLASAGTGEKSPVVQALENALKRDQPDGEGPWALIPEAAATQLQKHLNTMGSTGALGKVGQMANSNFRKVVLSTSPSWAAGNVIEGAFRSGIAKAGPLSYLTGRKALKNLSDSDLLAAEEVALRTVGGGHFSSADRLHVRRDAEQFRDTSMEGAAQALGKFWRAPGPKHMAQAWHTYTQVVFENMRRVESQFQIAMLGKAIRQSELYDGKIIGLSRKAMDDVAKGLKDTNNVVAFGRAVDRMYGKYAKDSPEMRLAKAYYTPFISWFLNSVKFVTDVLPRDHPTATALIAQAEIATEEWRKDHGLDMFMEGAVPGWLQGSIPMAGGGKQRSPNRYLPFGAFGDPLDTASGQVLPQYMGPILAGMGLDWSGSPIGGPFSGDPDQGEKAAAVASAFFGGQLPFLSLGLRVKDKGASALNPFKPTVPSKQKPKKLKRAKPKTIRRTTPSSGWGGSGSSSGGSSSGGGWGGSSSSPSGGGSSGGWGG